MSVNDTGALAEVERLCEVMHDAYEAAAAAEGWETQERSRKPWADVPEANKATMRTAVRALLAAARVEQARAGEGALREVLSPGDPDMRMHAYYYGFERTGVGIIDRILSAVAIAGKGFHHTEDWTAEDARAFYPDGLTHEERIQKAADEAADALRAALTEDQP